MRFPIYGSSLSKTCCKQIRQLPVGHMQLPVAVRGQKSQIVPVVGAAFCAVNHVMHMPSRVAGERFFTCRTSTVLRLPEAEYAPFPSEAVGHLERQTLFHIGFPAG